MMHDDGPERRPASIGRCMATAWLAGLAVAGCSWEQAYYATREWQRNECNRRVDAVERERCLAQTTTSYDSYRQQREASQPPQK
jgi:hypothetical protein